MLRRRWTPILGAGTIRFRRELRLFQRFSVETRILHWTGANLVLEQRILTAGEDGRPEIVAAVALVRGGLYDRRARSFVPIATLMDAVGISAESPPASPAVAAFLAGEEGLKRGG
ncbi:thioesterase family protein [Enterovirga sp.]|uniref:thioesterase family protein n=1 Tax=Enterovirga sp. TaxID=2026350 RepID=UPI002A5D74F5|nr:thioesterase [Enterovirga sp.]